MRKTLFHRFRRVVFYIGLLLILITGVLYLLPVSDEVLIPVKNGKDRYGYINPSGRWVIEPQFEMAHPFGSHGYGCALYLRPDH